MSRNENSPSASQFHLAQFAGAIEWLRGRGLSASFIAGVLEDGLGADKGNVRVIVHRQRYATPKKEFLVTGEAERLSKLDLFVPPTRQVRHALGLHEEPDLAELAGSDSRTLDELETRIPALVAHYRKMYQFVEGAAAIRRLREKIGFTGQARRIRLLAYLHQLESWFLVHTGRTRTALFHANKAMQLSRIAYHDSEDSLDLRRLIETGLIASHACLLRSEPLWSKKILGVIAGAGEKAGQRMGSDFYRQEGVLYFQKGRFDLARHSFETSSRLTEKVHPAPDELVLAMTSTRHTNLFRPIQWGKAQELVRSARLRFGTASLEYSMCINWAAACGLATDSPSVRKTAIELLHSPRSLSPEFGFQTTISKLLQISPDLPLSAADRYEWITMVLYENAFRNR
jgi:hypothetical protein